MSIPTPNRKNVSSLSARSKLAKTAAVLSLAAAATLAAPGIANAYVAPEPGASVSSSVVAPGGTVTFAAIPGTFEGGEPVTISLSGENASGASLAMIRPAAVQRQELGTREAQADGSLAGVDIKLPENASGTYEVLATSPSVPEGVTASFTVETAGATTSNRDDAAAALPATGGDGGALLGLWVAGGALVMAGGAIAVGSSVRRHRQMAV